MSKFLISGQSGMSAVGGRAGLSHYREFCGSGGMKKAVQDSQDLLLEQVQCAFEGHRESPDLRVVNVSC